MEASELLLEYVEKHGWISVANIFNDNEYSVHPFTSNGFVCASKSKEAVFMLNTIDYENSLILERAYITVPYNHVMPQQSVSVMPFEHIQRFDALLFDQTYHYTSFGLQEDFPIPTIPTPAEVEAITLDENGFAGDKYPTVVLGDRSYTDKHLNNTADPKHKATEIATIDLHPDHPDWTDADYVGLRIAAYQQFLKNQKLFCQQMNKMFGVSDCK